MQLSGGQVELTSSAKSALQMRSYLTLNYNLNESEVTLAGKADSSTALPLCIAKEAIFCLVIMEVR